MAITTMGVQSSHAMLFSQQAGTQNSAAKQSAPLHAASQMSFSVKNNPAELILQAAMEKINEMFAPHLGDGAVEQAAASGMDMSPEATAERILSFATHIFARAENDQVDLPVDEQRSRERLFDNIRVGIERGFEQAREILGGMDALEGDVKETVDATYEHVQQGLNDLAQLLGLLSPDHTEV
ncbi:hypothetical protein MMIC_P0081 [Mariprofundus micogutta]|uniref:DUF5610 domain-containing protein n=1 Tax=Mariprofundus micogutta TaxID=1921010 RepID=A0A1L8CJQ8_9PROT|nr:DUF5610 domain-containing protein [Mariprofundus micogutta]GAV19152.1 hypothetical protein MMIC_P0081 [Mariprofundus micogutta]